MRKLLRGGLCSLVFSLVSCMPNFKSVDIEPLERQVENSKDTKKLRAWQYPINITGGFLVHILAHEGGHAAAVLAHDVGIKEFRPYPGFINEEFHGGWILYESDYWDLSSSKRALIDIAGPAADVALAEITSYNLRNGNISPEYQPFWATSSLMARGGLVYIAIKSFSDGYNDFLNFEEDVGVSKETMAGLVALYTALNAKRITKEFRVALGKDSYDYKPEKKGELNLFPVGNGLGLVYSVNF